MSGPRGRLLLVRNMAAAPQPVEEAAAAAHAPIGISLRHISLYLERAPLLQRSVGGGGAGAARHGLRILSDITGDVPAGSLFLIIGGSGSGKTSLLNALALRLGSVGYRLTGAPWGRLHAASAHRAGPPPRVRRADALATAVGTRRRNSPGAIGCCAVLCLSVSSAVAALVLRFGPRRRVGRGVARARHATQVAAQPAHVAVSAALR